MGDWPTIFDKSATLIQSDGRRIFVASPLGLGNIGFQIAKHQSKSTLDSLCYSLEGRQEKNVSRMSQLLRLVGGVGVSALNNQNLTRSVTEHVRSGKLIAFPLPPTTLLSLAGSLGMARSLAPTMINLPSLDGVDPENPNVTSMDEGQRMLWVLKKCGEILDRTGKSEVAQAFKQLLEPEVIGLVVAGLIVWGASHFVGIGFIFDIAMVVVMGVAVIQAFESMWEIYKIITKASTKTELTRAAQLMADMVIDIGVEAFLAIVLKGAAKSRFRAPPSKSAKTGDRARSTAAPSKGKTTETKSPKGITRRATDPPDVRRAPNGEAMVKENGQWKRVSETSNDTKGKFGEMMADDFAARQNPPWEKLPPGTKNADMSTKGHQGIDAVYRDPGPPPRYIIADAKYGSSGLSKLKDGTQQMSPKWVRDRLSSAVGKSQEKKVTRAGYEPMLLKVDKNGKVVEKTLKNKTWRNEDI